MACLSLASSMHTRTYTYTLRTVPEGLKLILTTSKQIAHARARCHY